MRRRRNRSNQIKGQKVMPTEVIRVQGVCDGSGATHLAIGLANFLASKERYRVAIVELREESELAQMLEGDMFVADGLVGFTHQLVDYYPKVTWEEATGLRQKRYDYLLFLYPPANRGLDFPAECHRQIIVGSLKPWSYREYQKFMRDFYLKEDILRWDLYGLFLNKNEAKRFEAEFHVPIRTLPFIENPFHLQSKDVAFLQQVLTSWQ